ncbi:MAG: hypothetical protein HFH27_11400 [Clostridiaceae bacterium]|nr:hypothetical protein [Clostridiaceae bacterium]
MKRIFSMMLACCILILLSACGGGADEPAGSPAEPAAGGTQAAADDSAQSAEADGGSSQSIEADKGLLDVTITIPADFVGESTQEDLDALAEENGFKSVTLNEDGTATYVMGKSKHNELMQEISDEIDAGLEEMVGSEEFPSITAIEANGDYTQFRVTIESETLGLNESLSVMAFYLYGGMYHAFNGTQIENVNVQFINAATGEIVEETNSKDIG